MIATIAMSARMSAYSAKPWPSSSRRTEAMSERSDTGFPLLGVDRSLERHRDSAPIGDHSFPRMPGASGREPFCQRSSRCGHSPEAGRVLPRVRPSAHGMPVVGPSTLGIPYAGTDRAEKNGAAIEGRLPWRCALATSAFRQSRVSGCRSLVPGTHWVPWSHWRSSPGTWLWHQVPAFGSPRLRNLDADVVRGDTLRARRSRARRSCIRTADHSAVIELPQEAAWA
jgi:hypothetical protein